MGNSSIYHTESCRCPICLPLNCPSLLSPLRELLVYLPYLRGPSPLNGSPPIFHSRRPAPLLPRKPSTVAPNAFTLSASPSGDLDVPVDKQSLQSHRIWGAWTTATLRVRIDKSDTRYIHDDEWRPLGRRIVSRLNPKGPKHNARRATYRANGEHAFHESPPPRGQLPAIEVRGPLGDIVSSGVLHCWLMMGEPHSFCRIVHCSKSLG
jgi:hypothetical protein